MQFKPRREASMIGIFVVIIIIVGFPFLKGVLTDRHASLNKRIGLLIVFVLIEVLLCWMIFYLRYIFMKQYLYIRSGFFRTKIKYENIFKIEPAKTLFVGNQALNSKRHAIEIHYRNGVFGSIKIAPVDQAGFLQALQEKCPHVKIAGFEREGKAL